MAEAIAASDANGQAPASETELLRELSLTDGPRFVQSEDSAGLGRPLHNDEHILQQIPLADSSIRAPSSLHEDQPNTEPNFLPPFASEENKAINREIQVGHGS